VWFLLCFGVMVVIGDVIVRRTASGSGKESKIVSFNTKQWPTVPSHFVVLDPDGRDVYYYGILRSNITTIPQVPELLTGSMRQHLDSFDRSDNAARMTHRVLPDCFPCKVTTARAGSRPIVR